jgi:hypothetical protein
MSVKQSLENKLIKIGKNNSPTLVAMSIAAAKGVFRPAFTMMDKQESYDTKRYTAYREGLTELIAIPVYYMSGVISIAVPKNFMSRRIYNLYKSGDKSKEVEEAVKHAENLAKVNLSKIKITSAFAGVCTSALLIIPLLCSATIKPIMTALEKKSSKTADTALPTVLQKPEKQLNTFKGTYGTHSLGMKVGAL